MAAPGGIRLQVIIPPNEVQRACTVVGGSVALGGALVASGLTEPYKLYQAFEGLDAEPNADYMPSKS